MTRLEVKMATWLANSGRCAGESCAGAPSPAMAPSAWHFHHIDPGLKERTRDGRLIHPSALREAAFQRAWDSGNLLPLCANCHAVETDRQRQARG